ncbi:MAG: formate--phosphoribosylaminoimidazolecarboxamide ligase, partial [archaeon]
MIPVSVIHGHLLKYDKKNIKIGTVCSHSALQIFAGARDEGFQTVGICTKDRLDTYKAFPHACPDEFVVVDSIKDILKPEMQDKLISMNVILVPHGSFVEYLGPKNIEDKLYVPMIGNRAVLDWEGDRKKERHWLYDTAGLSMPRVFLSPDDIDCLSIVKFDGAKGGAGYFKVSGSKEYYEQIKKRGLVTENTTIQEYLVGVRYYMHFFYSPISDSGYKCRLGAVELTGVDRRDESNIDELHRLGMTNAEMAKAGVVPGYTVTGNTGCVLRESLLPHVLEMGKRVVDASAELFSPGMNGPFCLETVVTPDLEVKVFEISARIVAGTNVYAKESPYSHLFYGKPMSCGRRIALEVKDAVR